MDELCLEGEEWRDVVGYEGLYQVSNLGRVRSLDRTIVDTMGRKRVSKGRILRLGKVRSGYLNAVFTVDNKSVNKSVHRLVAEAFMPNADFSLDVHHVNGDRCDNRVENLRFVTTKENNALRSWPEKPDWWKESKEYILGPRESIVDLPNEKWMPVVGYEGLYEVSNMGRVKSVERDIVNCNGVKTHWNEALLRQTIASGYLKVNLSKEGKSSIGLVHQLVAKAFLERIDGKDYVDHINGVRTDNHVDNLRWVTASENNKHIHELGHSDKEAMRKRGIEHVRKFGTATPPKPVIRNDGVWFESVSAAARAIGTGQGDVSAVAHGVKKSIKGYTFRFAEQVS